MTLEEARKLFDDLTSMDPESMEELLFQYDLLHEAICHHRHMACCADPLPMEWNALVDKLALMRAQAWILLVFWRMLDAGEAGDPHDLDTMTTAVVPPDTTSHLRNLNKP